MEMRWPSKETTFNRFSLISNNSPDINLFALEAGIIALDAKIFLEIVRKLPDNEVTIETDAAFKTLITCEKAKFNIIGKSGEDFSYLPYVERKDSITMSQLNHYVFFC